MMLSFGTTLIEFEKKRLMELQKRKFNGIRQVSMSVFNSSPNKDGYLWFVKDGSNKYIYFGSQLYAEINDKSADENIAEAIDKLIEQDLLHSFDTEGKLKNEITFSLNGNVLELKGKGDALVASMDLSKFAVDGMVNSVSYDEQTHTITIAWNTDAGITQTEINLSSLIDVYTSGNGIQVEGNVISAKLDPQSQSFLTISENGIKLSGIVGSEIEIGEGVNDAEGNQVDKTNKISSVLDTIFTTIKTVRDNAISVEGDGKGVTVTSEEGNGTRKKVSLLTEKVSDNTVNDGHIEIVNDSADGVYARMYYMSNIESVSGNIDSNEKSVLSGDNVSLYNASVSNNARLNIKAQEEVEMENVTFSGDFPKSTQNTMVSINGSEKVTLTNVKFNDNVNGYNGFEIGLSSDALPKYVNIKDCDFGGKLTNNAILIFGTQDNAVINIENCHFGRISNALRISNKTNATNVTINVKNCSVDEWDTRKEWEGFMICEDYTSGTVALEQSNNLFANSKITVNFTNLTHKGEKITADYEGQLCYVWYDNGNKKETDNNRIPTINFL